MVTTRHQKRIALQAEQKNRDTLSARKVLDIPELLESILLDVDMKTLLLAQRVDKTFKATIDSSVLLQRKLWLLPDTRPLDEDEPSDSTRAKLNPLLSTRNTEHELVLGNFLETGDDADLYLEAYLDQLCKPAYESWQQMQVVRFPAAEPELKCYVQVYPQTDYDSYLSTSLKSLPIATKAGEVLKTVLQWARWMWPARFDDEGQPLA